MNFLMVPWITMPTVLKHYYLILLKGPNYLIHFLVIWIPTEFFPRKFSDPDVIESLFLEIIVPHGKNIIVGCVYRPPNQNTAMFIDKFNNVLALISKDNKHCYVMGDFSQDPSPIQSSSSNTGIYWQLIFTRLSSSHLQSNTPHLILCDANWPHIHQQTCP